MATRRQPLIPGWLIPAVRRRADDNRLAGGLSGVLAERAVGRVVDNLAG